MEYEVIEGLSTAIDNVYANTSEDGTRKTKAKLTNDVMEITYVTILNSGRESDLTLHMIILKKESDEFIKSRLNTIKKSFKDCARRDLIAKKIGNSDNVETLTISPYSPFRKLKYTCTYCYEVK